MQQSIEYSEPVRKIRKICKILPDTPSTYSCSVRQENKLPVPEDLSAKLKPSRQWTVHEDSQETAFIDAELCELMDMLFKRRTGSPRKIKSRIADCGYSSEQTVSLAQSKQQQVCCFAVVPLPSKTITTNPIPPPRRYYLGFWRSVARRVLVKRSQLAITSDLQSCDVHKLQSCDDLSDH
jgi:hypothetical protein